MLIGLEGFRGEEVRSLEDDFLDLFFMCQLKGMINDRFIV
jgi:hypothetical protein